MTQTRHSHPPKGHSRQERSIDKMVEDTFPASDATQLPGRAADAADHRTEPHDPKRDLVPPAPRTIGNQGVLPGTRMREESVPLGGNDVVTFRFNPTARRLSLHFSDEGMWLDSEALDRLIAALSAKRAQMGE
jgi:hypothetical protein